MESPSETSEELPMRTIRLPSPHRAGRAGPAALLMVLTLLVTGCFRVDVRTEVNDDGSGTVEMLSAIDADSVLELLAPFGEEFTGGEELTRESICEESLAETDVPEGATVEPYDEDGFCGVRVTADFGPGEDPAATIGELFGDDAGEGEFVLERDGDGWHFEATIEANEEEITGDLPGFGAEDLLGDAEFLFRLKLPGRQVEHNADRIEGDGTLVWDIDVFAETRTELFARTEPGDPITGGDGGGSSSIVWIVLGLVVVAVAVGALVWFLRRRSSGDGDDRPDPAGAAGSTTAPVPGASTGPGSGPTPVSAATMPTSPPVRQIDPTWDAELGTWVVEDPERGRLRYDETGGGWVPI